MAMDDIAQGILQSDKRREPKHYPGERRHLRARKETGDPRDYGGMEAHGEV